jgi:hypothetical protein
VKLILDVVVEEKSCYKNVLIFCIRIKSREFLLKVMFIPDV